MANTLSLVRYGRYSTVKESDYGTIASGSSRATVFDAISQNVWATTFRFFAGKAGGSSAVVRPSAYRCDGSNNPLTRIGYGASVTVSTSMAGGSGGASNSSAVSHSDNAPTDAAIMLFSGKHYALDLLDVSGGDLNHSMQAASLITADNEQFYDRTSPGDPPPSSFGAYAASVEGHVTVSLEGWANVAPVKPATGIAPSGSITSTAPTFTANFRDLNGAYGTSSTDGVDTGDCLNQYQIQVRRSSDHTSFWAPGAFTATAGEQAANAISQPYAGTALVRGTAYEWRIRMSDQFGAWSDWSDADGSGWFTFTPVSLGYVTLDDVPTGKQEAITGITFKGRWNHQSATTMKTVQSRILASDGVTVLQTGANYDIADVASSALPGTLFSVTWANTGFSDLAWGRSYYYQTRGYDGTVWSDWSTARSFSTNAAPSVPTGLSPSGGAIFTDLPKLTCTFTDADDTTGTGLTGVFRITRPDTSTVDVTPTYNATTGKWEFQTTATELSAFGAYSWKATGYDGTIYSGEAAALGSATFSSSATFTYSSGPVVAVSSPTDGATVTGAELDVAWSVTSGGPQVKYEVLLYPDGDPTPVYDSGLLTSTATSHHIPSGYYVNGDALDLVVRVQNGTPLDGYSNTVNLLVAYTPPDAPTNFQANPASIGLDPSATAIRLSWDQTSYAAPDFVRYTLYRSADGGPDAARIILARLTSPSDTALMDVIPASDWTYTYELVVSIAVGTDIVDSAAVTAQASVTLDGTVLSLLGNGETYRANLRNVTERAADRTMPESVYQSPASLRPVTVRSATRYWVSTFSGVLASDTIATAAQRADELDALDAAAQNGIVCIRDGRGRKRFCKIGSLNLKDEKPDFFSFGFTGREETASEGTT